MSYEDYHTASEARSTAQQPRFHFSCAVATLSMQSPASGTPWRT